MHICTNIQCHRIWIQFVALYPELFRKPMCPSDFYSVLQVSANNRQTELNHWIFAWNAYLAVTSIKHTMLYLRVNLWARSSTLGYGAEARVFFWHKAPSKFFRFFYFPCKKGSSQAQDRQKGIRLLPQICRLLSVPSGQQQTSNIWCVQSLLGTSFAPFPFLPGQLGITLTIKPFCKLSIMNFGTNTATVP